MTQIILSQRKEVFKAWKSASKHIRTKCSVEQTKCTIVPDQILYDREAQAERLQRASSRNMLKIPHCLPPSHGSLLSLPWRCNILPHLNPGNWFYVLSAILKSCSLNISERPSSCLVLFSYHLASLIWITSYILQPNFYIFLLFCFALLLSPLCEGSFKLCTWWHSSKEVVNPTGFGYFL